MADEGPFIKVSEGMPEHPKIVSAGGDAAWLNVCAWAYAARNKTDGLVPSSLVPRLSDRRQPMKLAAVLVDRRLWHEPGHDCKRCPQPLPGSYVIHDYLQHQRSAEEIRAGQAAKGEGGAYGNHVRWHTGRGQPDPECRFCVGNASHNRSHMRSDTDQSSESHRESHTDRIPIAEVEVDKDPPLSPPTGGRRTRRQAYDYAGDQDFQQFWQAYPAKNGKPAAYKAWLKALARGADPQHVIAAAQAYRDSPSRNPEHTKYAQGWLNDERYNDAPEPDDGAGDDFWER